ncbi:MAG: O-antigen ligase family protein [Planctomycetes bacterium]|nr:O-antigen ligase family protein [Planctomycetota bacterium]
MGNPGVPTRLGRLLDAAWLDRSRIARAFGRQHKDDELGTRLHAALACLFLFAVSGPTTVTELAGIPLVVFFLIRVRHTYRIWGDVFMDVRFFLLLALAAWMALSLLWSPNAAQGLDELGSMRWAWCMLVLWPVIDRREVLIAAYAGGLLLGNGAQLAHALQDPLGFELWSRFPGRVSGWWDPVVGGSMLCAALGLHLPAALMGLGRTRLFGAIGSLVTLAGIVATGTRGAWIAAALLVAIVTLVAIVRAERRRRALVTMAIVAAIIATATIAALTRGETALGDRVRTGWSEVTAAVRDGEFHSDTGARVYMNARAFDALARHPVRGVGAGGYRSWVNAHDPENRDIAHDHAHSAPLHAGATLGLVGLAIMGLILACGLRAGLGACRGNLGSYAAGPAFAMVGLALAGLFDTVQLNAQTAAQIGILIALCPPVLPPTFRNA